jgi:hypothetical protein
LCVEGAGGFFVEAGFQQGANVEFRSLFRRHRRILYSNPQKAPRPIFLPKNAPYG